jgi:hypothetical protein
MQFDILDQLFQLPEISAHECQLLQVIPSKHIHEVINKNVFVLLEQISLIQVKPTNSHKIK